MGRKVSSVKVGRITGVPVSSVHHCGENLVEGMIKYKIKMFLKLNIFYFIFSTVFIFYEDKENLRKSQLSQKVISRPVLFQSYVLRMTNALRTHEGSMTSFLYIYVLWYGA